jgi:hypothetical protein
MDDQTDAKLNAEALIQKMYSIMQRHIANMENSLAMMRNGHFIEAYQRLLGTKEGLIYMKLLVDKNLNSNGEKLDEKNIQ